MATLADLLAAAQGGPTPSAPEGPGILDQLLHPGGPGGGGQDFLQQLIRMASQPSGGGGGAQGAGVGPIDTSGITTGNALAPGSPLLDTRRGVTLQGDALQALLQAARRYDYLPKGRELGLFGPQSTYRSPQEQADLYAAKPGVAAPPGQSFHQQGLAIDVPAALQTDEFERLLRRLGWNQGLSFGEPWHWSFGVTG
jgi:hypothetical protein